MGVEEMFFIGAGFSVTAAVSVKYLEAKQQYRLSEMINKVAYASIIIGSGIFAYSVFQKIVALIFYI